MSRGAKPKIFLMCLKVAGYHPGLVAPSAADGASVKENFLQLILFSIESAPVFQTASKLTLPGHNHKNKFTA